MIEKMTEGSDPEQHILLIEYIILLMTQHHRINIFNELFFRELRWLSFQTLLQNDDMNTQGNFNLSSIKFLLS